MDWDAEERRFQLEADEAFERMKLVHSKVAPTASSGEAGASMADPADLMELAEATAADIDAQAKLKAFLNRRRREDPNWWRS